MTAQPGRTRGAGGYAVALTALLLIPLLAAASVAVDLGSRYAEAAKIQRAADAAALAGVTMLPRGLTAATTEARQVAARNGYQHGVDGITVEVTEVGPERIQVRILDPEVPEYFGGLFSGDPQIARSATAKYVRAVSLGSPRNFIGTGNLLGSPDGGDMRRIVGRTEAQTATLRENYWLAISGQCSSKENGDRFNTISDANHTNSSNPRGIGAGAGWAGCDPGGPIEANSEFQHGASGYAYIYAVTVPAGYDLGQLRIQVFDPATCNGSRPGDPGNASTQGMTTTYTVRGDSTDPLSGTVLATVAAGRRGSGCNAWEDLAIVNPSADGDTYFIQVEAGRNSNSGTHSNGFALRANVPARNTSGRFWACSSDVVEGSPFYDPKCPQVYGLQDMGVAANLTGTRAEFFLAAIGPEYNGKQLDITLFDPGEGAELLRIKDPNGSYATFDWSVDCPGGATQPTGGCAGSGTTSLDLVGDTASCTENDAGPGRCSYNPQPGPRRISRWKYNDRSLTLSVDLPDDIVAEYGGATWWKIEYTTGASPTDRTTWSVEVKGDPVRLIPNPGPPPAP